MIHSSNSFDLNLRLDFPERKYTFTLISLFVILIVIYGNSFQGEWLFDDIQSIVENRNCHLESFSWPNIKKACYVNNYMSGGDILTRPFAFFSFALNYYFGGLDVYGYHLVNFTIHFITAFFLFLVIYRTLNLPLLKDRMGEASYSIALLTAFFWASSPVQVSAVTYIVQRMASMAGMFYIMAMYFYIRGRTAPKPKILPYVFCIICGGMSYATKQVAALLPVSILLYELILIQGISRENLRKNLKIIIPLLFLSLMALAGLIFFSAKLLDYSQWTFTLKERLLTEPRVILFYITLLVYPVSSRLMMEHDIELSHSLIDPITTLPAILAIIIVIGYALCISRKKPLLSFCIIFFFLNHLIEGSFIPLDIAFEHRNYTPSMFFFVPVAVFMVSVLDYFAYRKSIQFIMAFGMTFLLAAQGHTVVMRNDIFRYQKILWTDNIDKAPKLSRPHGALGALLYQEGNHTKANEETKKALSLANYPNLMQPAVYNANLGLAYYSNNDDESAISYFTQAIKNRMNIPPAYNGLAMVMLKKGLFPIAHELCNKAIRLDPANAQYETSMALILLKKGDPDGALQAARKALHLQKNINSPNAVIAEAYRLKGNYANATLYWKLFLEKEPGNLAANLALMELYYRKGEKAPLKKTVGRILMMAEGKDILALPVFNPRNDVAYVPERGKIKSVLEVVFQELGQELKN